MNKISRYTNIRFVIFSVIIATIFVFVASYSTSQLYPNYYGHDSAQFQLIGKCWLKGIIPLLDIFDHKGPLIFLINAIGYYATGNSSGVLYVQIIFLSFTIYIFCLMTLQYLSSQSATYCVVVIILLFLCSSYNGGNLTEEYCLPFISISIYFQIGFLNKKVKQHNPFYSAIYGISFAICLCTRATNAIMICSGVLIIYILLLKSKLFKNLVINILFFVAGALAICLPFVLYYHLHDGLYEAFYCTILANIEYKKHIHPWIFNTKKFNYFVYYNVFFPTYCLFFASIFYVLRKKTSLVFLCLLTSILETYLFLSGGLFCHYATIAVPQLLLFLCELIYIIKNNIKISFVLNVLKYYCCLFVCIFSIYNAIDFISTSKEIYNKYCSGKYEYDDILNLANKQENFIVYGGDSLVHFYLRNNITPCYKYYILQEWQSKNIPEIAKKIATLYSSCKAKWVLTDNN